MPATTRLIVASALLLAFAGCGESDTRGLVISENFFGVNSDVNQRKLVADNIRTSLDADLKPRWHSEVEITEKPVWVDGRRDFEGSWIWPSATVKVVLVGEDMSVPSPVSEAEVKRAINEYFARKLVKEPKPGTCTVAVESRIQPRYAAPTAPVVMVPATATGATAAAVAPGAPLVRAYIVQPGDTLADISTLFYGSPQHWRHIVESNPGLDPAALTPGQRLAVPPLPQK